MTIEIKWTTELALAYSDRYPFETEDRHMLNAFMRLLIKLSIFKWIN